MDAFSGICEFAGNVVEEGEWQLECRQRRSVDSGSENASRTRPAADYV